MASDAFIKILSHKIRLVDTSKLIRLGTLLVSLVIAGPLVALVGLIIGGILLGIITGVGLLWIFKFPVQEE